MKSVCAVLSISPRLCLRVRILSMHCIFLCLFCIPHAFCFSLANETLSFFFQVVIRRIFHIRSIWSYLNSGNAGLVFSMNVLQLWSLIRLLVRLKKYVLLTKLYFKTCFTPLPLRQMMLNNVQAKEKKRSCDNLMKCPQMAGLNNFLTGFGCEADALTKYAASLRSSASLEDNRCCSDFNNRASCFYTLSPTYVAKNLRVSQEAILINKVVIEVLICCSSDLIRKKRTGGKMKNFWKLSVVCLILLILFVYEQNSLMCKDRKVPAVSCKMAIFVDDTIKAWQVTRNLSKIGQQCFCGRHLGSSSLEKLAATPAFCFFPTAIEIIWEIWEKTFAEYIGIS